MSPTDVRRDIQRSVLELIKVKYDHDNVGGLPIRPDVARFAAAVLFSDNPTYGLSESILGQTTDHEVVLQQNGTISVILECGEKSLYLDVPCGGIVVYVKLLEDESTTIEGIVRTGWPVVNQDGLDEINDLISWLIQE